MSVPKRGAIVVTGASTGIGAASAVALAERGYTVFAGVRTNADGERIASAHERIRALHLDVTDRASIDAAAQTVAASEEYLLGLVNNAGIAIGGPLEYLPLDELRRIFEINVFGAVAVTQAFLPQLRLHPSRIAFVGSISGRLAVPYIAPYSASKFALRALADAWRIELAPAHVGVSLIEPGSVKTPIWQKGRAARHDMDARLPKEAPAYYREGIAAIVRGTEYEELHAMPVERVSRAIVHALMSPRPRARYLLGTPARLGSLLALLPPPLHDRFLRASMRLP